MNKETYDKIIEQGLTLDEYFFMYSLTFGEGYEVPLPASSYAKLTKLGCWKNDELTDTAKKFVVSLSLRQASSDEGFEEYYAAFPLSDEYLPFFPKTRPIRCRRQEAKAAYMAAANEVPYQDLVMAARNYVKSFDQHSGPLKHSPYKFMKGPVNFLRDKKYLEYR